MLALPANTLTLMHVTQTLHSLYILVHLCLLPDRYSTCAGIKGEKQHILKRWPWGQPASLCGEMNRSKWNRGRRKEMTENQLFTTGKRKKNLSLPTGSGLRMKGQRAKWISFCYCGYIDVTYGAVRRLAAEHPVKYHWWVLAFIGSRQERKQFSHRNKKTLQPANMDYSRIFYQPHDFWA